MKIYIEYEKAKKEMEENLRRQLEQNEKEMEAIKLGYEQRLVEALAKVSQRLRSNKK